jgi:hypothetical protein
METVPRDEGKKSGAALAASTVLLIMRDYIKRRYEGA